MAELRMRVDINGRWLSKPLTGTGRYSEEVTKALIAQGCDVVLWVPSDAVVPGWARAGRVRRTRTRGQVFEQITLPVLTAGRALLCMGGPAPLFKRRQVVVLHDATPFRLPETYSRAFAGWYRLMYRSIARSGATIATVSEFSAEELAAVLNHPRDRIVLAEPAATIADAAVAPGFEIPERYFLTVGTLAAHKNLLPVLTAFAAAGLTVVSVGTIGATQVFAAAGLPDDASIIQTGRVTDQELRWLYTHAEALLFPSLYEGFGLPALEAQKAGCVVIASRSGPLTNLLGDSALLLDPTDAAAFVRAAEALLGSDMMRHTLVEQGRRNAARFAWTTTAKALTKALDAI